MKTKGIVLLVLAIILLVGVFHLAKSKKVEQNTPEAPVITEKVFEIAVENGKVVLGGEPMKVYMGDMVKIKVTSDKEDELHLHGYDKKAELEKDVPGELSFVANLTGRFELELHHSGIELGALEVFPK